MTTKLSVWGNSVGIRLPKSLLDEAGLDSGSLVKLTLQADGSILVKAVEKTPTLKELLSGMTPYNRPEDPWAGMEPVGREIW